MSLVSIILPTYNRHDLIQRAIDSVLSQDHTNWELIIWDDGSEKKVDDLLSDYDDDRIQYFYDINHGMSFALNQAISRSGGEYVAFIDDDDQWINDKLRVQLDVLIKYPEIDMIFGNYLNINIETGNQALGFDQNKKIMQLMSTSCLGDQVHIINSGFLMSLAIENSIAFDTVIIRRSTLDRIGRFNEELKNGMDLEYWWRFGLQDCVAAYTERVCLNRFKYSKSLSNSGISTIINLIASLDACSMETIGQGREDLLSLLRVAYRNAYQNLILARAKTGDKRGAWTAFLESLTYGIQPGSLRVLVEGLCKNVQ